jgi:hypothetical protein
MNYKIRERSCFVGWSPSLLAALFLIFNTNSAWALGTVGFDSSSFFYTSSDRGTASTTLSAIIAGESKNDLYETQGDLRFYTFVSNEPQVALESKELYITTSRKLTRDSQFTLGRRIYNWSNVDLYWNQMSLWSPRFTWDPIYPEQIGMTGMFYNYQHKNFELTAFGSPLAIPERGTPISEKDGKITSSNPFFQRLPTSQVIQGTDTQINYSLKTPPLEEILFRPNFAVKGRFNLGAGFWISAGTAILPVHMVQLAAEPYYSLGIDKLQVNIRPQFPMRNLNTFETGYDDPDKSWSVFVSGSYEQPFQFENEENWLNPIITPSSIVSAGTRIQMTRNFWFTGSALVVHEQPFRHSSTLPDVTVDLPTRFPIKQGFLVGGEWHFTDRTGSTARWTQDLIEQNHMASIEFKHWISKSEIEIGAGADMIFANSTQGWVGQYNGNDRIRGWLKYAF